MARTTRDNKLESRAARSRLEVRGKPYYRSLEPGLHLGYRRNTGGTGKWVGRYYVGGQTYEVETLATADDFSDADGVAILDFKQAQKLARERMVERAHKAAGKTGPYTVADAMDEYLVFLDRKRKSGPDARFRDAALIRPKLGNIELAALKAKKLRHWHAGLAEQAPRLRTKEGKPQKFRKVGSDDETKRRRRASANRTLTILKAALNMAWREGEVPSDTEWRRVEPFENVDAARVRYLTIAEAQRLRNACEPDFRKLVQGALETGCRYGELASLTVSDFGVAKQRREDGTFKDVGTIAIRQSKSGKPRHVVLTADEGIAFFKQVCAGRAGSELMFVNAGGGAWGKSQQQRPIKKASARAKIDPPANFHVTRHTWASHAVMAGVPLLVVAKNLGHSDTRMVEKHYGHLAPSYIIDAIQAGAPRYGFKPDKKIATLAGRA
jgi:integrase